MNKRVLTVLIWLISFCSMAQNEVVLFSAKGGFYPHSIYLSLGCFYPDHYIRYTTDGSEPTEQSHRFEHPIFLDEHLFSDAHIHSIATAPDDLMYCPDTVQQCIVIRAAVFDKDHRRISNTVTNTYLIQDLGCLHQGLAVLSICADSSALFDHETGIFVPGVHWDPFAPSETLEIEPHLNPGLYLKKIGNTCQRFIKD